MICLGFFVCMVGNTNTIFPYRIDNVFDLHGKPQSGVMMWTAG